MTFRLRFVAVVGLLTLGVVAAPAWAQNRPTKPERPYRGLFGGGSSARMEQALTLSVSLGGGYDTNIQPNVGVPGEADPGPASREDGSFTYLVGDLTYTLNRNRFAFGAGFSANARYYPDIQEGLLATYSGSISESFQFTKRTSLNAYQTVAYQPFYAFVPFPPLFAPDLGEVISPETDFRAAETDSLLYTASASVNHGLSRRASLIGRYSYTFNDLGSDELDIAYHYAESRLSYTLTRDLAARVGYGYGRSDAVNEQDQDLISTHLIDAGLDFNRALSLTRKLKLSFNAGVTGTRDDETTHYAIIGGARLDREIGRSWNASLAYDRNVGFTPPFREPLLYDSLTFMFDGMISRRLQFHSTAAAVYGNVGLEEGDKFSTYYTTTGISYGLSRSLGLGIDYTFYRYSFDTVVLPEIRGGFLNRHSVRAYLTYWLPLIHRARRADATR